MSEIIYSWELLPNAVSDYFSPGVIWTRLPLGKDSDELISNFFFQAYQEYMQLYLYFVDNAEKISRSRATLLSEGQKKYLNYRAEKDPARNMFVRFYGKDWANEYIHNVLFPL